MNPHGRLLPVEMVLPSGDTPHPGKMLDMVMLVVPIVCTANCTSLEDVVDFASLFGWGHGAS